MVSWDERIGFEHYPDVVVIEKGYNPGIVFEGDNMGFGKGLYWRHIRLSSLEGKDDVFGEADFVQLCIEVSSCKCRRCCGPTLKYVLNKRFVV